jgi:lysine 2,3-aminomutase
LAGHVEGTFREKFSPYLKEKYAQARAGGHRVSTTVLERQYRIDDRERVAGIGERARHYEAGLTVVHEGVAVKGLERLYAQTVVLLLTTVCAAHCRWCLRGLYDPSSLSDEEIRTAARFCGAHPEIREVVVTGGDPLMVPGRLSTVVEAFARHAPQVRTLRLGTRVPLQDPARVDARLVRLFAEHPDRLELSLHINHEAELFPEVTEAIERLLSTGVRGYGHVVLLKGLNDSEEALSALGDRMRDLRVEPHYLFHCVPMTGMAHHRTSVQRGLELYLAVYASGALSGRSRPVYTLMTDVGKVMLHEGVIVAREGERILLQSHYSYAERKRYNPSWTLPDSASIDTRGLLRVWYQDGRDDDA